MSINWPQVGTTIANITSALTSAGVSSSDVPSVLNVVGQLMNPSQSAELQICAQLLQFAGNPQIEGQLAIKLATENGIPPAAASLAMTLTQPGTDIPTRVLQIEQIIKQGS